MEREKGEKYMKQECGKVVEGDGQRVGHLDLCDEYSPEALHLDWLSVNTTSCNYSGWGICNSIRGFSI